MIKRKKFIIIFSSYFLVLSIFIASGVHAQFGSINPPPGVSAFGGDYSGLAVLIGNLLKTAIAVAGLYALVNFLLAGYSFMSAGGDPKKIADSWAKIYQTIIGIIFTVGAFALAAMVSSLLYGNPTYILQLRVFGP